MHASLFFMYLYFISQGIDPEVARFITADFSYLLGFALGFAGTGLAWRIASMI